MNEWTLDIPECAQVLLGGSHMTARFGRRRKPAPLSEEVDLCILDVLGALGGLGGSILIWVTFVSFVSFVVRL
jgi:hypothetical protein